MQQQKKKKHASILKFAYRILRYRTNERAGGTVAGSGVLSETQKISTDEKQMRQMLGN